MEEKSLFTSCLTKNNGFQLIFNICGERNHEKRQREMLSRYVTPYRLN